MIRVLFFLLSLLYQKIALADANNITKPLGSSTAIRNPVVFFMQKIFLNNTYKKKSHNDKHFAVVDDCDFEMVKNHNWTVVNINGKFYATTKISRVTIYLHAFILGIKYVDHKDGDGLNCRRENIRACTYSQNMQNRIPFNGRKYKGVYFYKKTGRYFSQITINKKKIYLGLCETKEDAARKYDIAAKQYFGEFARLNFPEN